VSLRRTIVVHTTLAARTLRAGAARESAHGLQVLTMEQLAARLAGGFIQPIDREVLQDAVKAALASTQLGELDEIKSLPGMVRAAVDTLEKVWRAGFDLAANGGQPRLAALAALEREVLHRLPESMKRPAELVALAKARLRHAPHVLGPVEMHGHSEMSPCWRPLLSALAHVVPVVWQAGPRSVPDWLNAMHIRVERRDAENPQVDLFSCATPQHEVLEALRWARALIASGSARPEEIAIASASPAAFDDPMLALAREAELPICFVHGVKALTRRDGQTVAALADVLVKGISQERVRRLFALLHEHSPALARLVRGWERVLGADAALTTVERWRLAFDAVEPDDWPEGRDGSQLVLEILAMLAQGPGAASAAGERLLVGNASALWRRALREGPAEALPVTLAELRLGDDREAAASVVWTSAMALASAPRPYVWLLALNAGRWPRQIAEDRLIPDHVVPIEILDPLPVADADRRDYRTILATTARSVARSFSRRDAEGRLLGRSPLTAGATATYLSRSRTPHHVVTESDRLLARPREFEAQPFAVSSLGCWRDWQRAAITPHDGLVRAAHPRIAATLARPLSASSLRLLLRDPIRFLWKHALCWSQPDYAEEPFVLDAMSFGNLVHGVLETAVNALESGDGLAKASTPQIEAAVDRAAAALAASWEAEQPVPPAVIWQQRLREARDLAVKVLAYPLERLPDQKSWTELPFGMADQVEGRRLPWNVDAPVEIPGTGLRIRGKIDRLDVSSDFSRARVIDYKTGRFVLKQDAILDGGKEVQRCLYALAVKSLLGPDTAVQAALLYPRAKDGEEFVALPDVEPALAELVHAIRHSRTQLESGLALPGIDAADDYNDFAFALPSNAVATYLARKLPLAQERLAEAAAIWEMP